MSASIYYQPTKKNRHDVHTGSASAFIEAIERAFGGREAILSDKDIPTLKGMSAMENFSNNPFNDLIEGIEKFGEIKIIVEY
jgi:hypothetical protein